MGSLNDISVAILGATSHIAKGLIWNFMKTPPAKLSLFARAPERVLSFVDHLPDRENPDVLPIASFGSHRHDVIINCIGIGTPSVLGKDPSSVFSITESFDDLVIAQLRKHPASLCINFSSGAVYGTAFLQPAAPGTEATVRVNAITPQDYYRIAKMNSEAKHRACGELNIIDLRVFSYYSRFVDLRASFFITDIINALLHRTEFVTGPEDMVRDYSHPHDLFALVTRCIERGSGNDVYDVYSTKPVSKHEILDRFAKEFGLKVRTTGDNTEKSVTGSKSCYYSTNRKASDIGFSPQFSSLDTLISETSAILQAGAY